MEYIILRCESCGNAASVLPIWYKNVNKLKLNALQAGFSEWSPRAQLNP